ncbi:putative membrane protein (plasmid) [Streptomyces alboflavus]|uniref:Putative membrane protein n=1 Tax=Streptomyces alboflavus TaxID=67267 RepID=A0A291W3E1_9ACTN|nr:SCO6880 family protein [Streptomyces alboflavus]ATM24810.1 putative membrane protein [Streptomyces alboflavus]
MSVRTYQFGKHRPTGLVGRRDLGEQAVLGGGAALGILCGFIFNGVLVLAIVGMALPIVIAVAVVFVPYRPKGTQQRRTVYRWWRIMRYRRKALARTGGVWVSPAIEAGVRRDGTPPDAALAEPEGIVGMTWVPVSVRGQDAVVVLQPEAGCVTATLEIASPGLGGKEVEEQVVALERWGELLDAFGNTDEHPVKRIQVLARQVKSDPHAHQRFVAQRDESAATADAPQWLKDSYDALANAVSTSAEEHRYYITAHARFTRDLAADAAARGAGDEGVAAAMAAYMDELWSRCEDADLQVIAPLDAGRLTAVIRNSYDPDHAIWNTDLPQAHAFPRNVDVRDGAHVTTRAAGSTECWHHATAAVVSWPSTPVGPDFLSPLLIGMPDVIRTIAITQDLEPNGAAVERMLAEDTNNQAELLRDRQRGKNVDPRDLLAAEATGSRGMALAASGAAGAAVVGYVTISARSAEELERTKRTAASRARNAHLYIEWLDLEHARAFATTLPFAGGIK